MSFVNDSLDHIFSTKWPEILEPMLKRLDYVCLPGSFHAFIMNLTYVEDSAQRIPDSLHTFTGTSAAIGQR